MVAFSSCVAVQVEVPFLGMDVPLHIFLSDLGFDPMQGEKAHCDSRENTSSWPESCTGTEMPAITHGAIFLFLASLRI